MDFDTSEIAKRTVSRGILLELSALGLRGDGLSGRWLKWLKRRMLHILIYSMCAPYMCHVFPTISFASSFYIFSSASFPKIQRLFNLEGEKVGPSSK